MKGKNKYSKRSKISESKFRRLVYLWAYGHKAVKISELLGINRNTVNKYLHGIRERTIEYCYTVTLSKIDIEIKMSSARDLDEFLWLATDKDSIFFLHCKDILSSYRGIRKESYHLYLGECCSRYLYWDFKEDYYQLLLKILREKPLGS